MEPKFLENKLTSAEDAVERILEHQKFSNSYRKLLNEKRKKENRPLFNLIDTRAYVFDINPTQYQSFRIIPNMKNYYNFFNTEKLEFKSLNLSDNNFGAISINFVDKVKAINENNKDLILKKKEKKIEKTVVNSNSLNKKQKHIAINSRIISCIIDHDQKLSDDECTNSKKIISKTEVIQIRNMMNLKFRCHLKCTTCRKPCKYRLSEINPNNNFLTNAQLSNELHLHGHQKTRTMDKKSKAKRTLIETKTELYNNYISNHLIS